METTLKTPPGFIERHDIRSGAIECEGFEPCGVIFTTYDDPTAEKMDATRLLGAVIENTKLPADESRRFFTIVGGYYVERVQSAEGTTTCKTTHVFGVASDASQGFNIEEGGSLILADTWRLVTGAQDTFDPVRMMNEAVLGEEGWTLIVQEAYEERRLYPLSGEPIHIKVTCPTITSVLVTAAGTTNTTDTRACTVTLEGIDADSFVWNFGDGSPEEKTAQPAARHTFNRAETEKTYTITVAAQGPGDCSTSDSAEVTIPAKPTTPQPECPELTGLTATASEPVGQTQQVAFVAAVKGSGVQSYAWDFGDGKTETSQSPRITHTYTSPQGADRSYTASVTIKGPDACADDASTTVTVKHIPTIPPKEEKPPKERCPGAGFACWIPILLLVAIIVLYVREWMEDVPAIMLLALDVIWIVASLRCLCRPYLPFLKALEDDNGCKGAGLACLIPFIILILAVVFFLIETMVLVAMLVIVILVVIWIILTWGCLCRPYLPFRKG